MKKLYQLLCLLILTSFASYGQNVYQHFSELNGMEDYNDNTNLLYRIYSSHQDLYNGNNDNSIYLLNVANQIDSLFQSVFYSYNSLLGSYSSRVINSYDFWEKNPRKFIACGFNSTETLFYTIVDVYDGRDMNFQVIKGGGNFIKISHQNDSLVYFANNIGLLYHSIDGGFNWDTSGHFNAFSLSPFDDKVLFSSESGILNKTTDGGLTRHVVDTIPASSYRSDFLFYDKDTNYIYRVAYSYLQDYWFYKFLVSNNSGEANSWQVKFTSTLPIYLSVDNTVAGSVYLATGRYIYHSTDFGNTFNLFQTFDRKLVGIYKKPGSSKLYAATYPTIYEIDGSAINIIKRIPLDKEIFKFDPLDIGNKWVYNDQSVSPQDTKNMVYSREVIKDTILANQQIFKQIKNIALDSTSRNVSFIFERIDSSNGKVYIWNNSSGTEYLADDLSINLGDTINVSRFILYQGTTLFDSLNSKSIFGLAEESHVYIYYSLNSPIGYRAWYSLTKDFGMTNHTVRVNWDSDILSLKGANIKGVVYGDTSFVVGIKDKYQTQPNEFVLSQNYPNPFNPTTAINYSIPKAGNVKLTVYNVLGTKIASILNEYKPAGNYSVQFNANNLASGIYFYKLEAGYFSQIKKMMFVK